MSRCYIQVLGPQGLEEVSYQADTLQDAATYEPDGIYTTTNTYNTFQTLKFDAHLDRMEDSARREGIPLTLDRPRLKSTLRQMIAAYDQGSVRFRITVPRDQPDHFIITLEPFQPPSAALIQAGVRCVTAPGMQRRNPSAKTNDWAQDRQQFEKPEGVYEVLLVNGQQEILEGFSSNFYAILDDVMRTARQDVLAGIAQQVVFAVAPDIIPVQHKAIRTADLPRTSEAFITSSSRGIVPVVEIDSIQLGDGKPGPYTRALREAYGLWVQTHLEDL
ncbi:MAG: aminotransferase class IV [Anaerolineae bacterium]|nr:aminotransferase class IV [Anaerolineae bacterium]